VDGVYRDAAEMVQYRSAQPVLPHRPPRASATRKTRAAGTLPTAALTPLRRDGGAREVGWHRAWRTSLIRWPGSADRTVGSGEQRDRGGAALTGGSAGSRGEAMCAGEAGRPDAHEDQRCRSRLTCKLSFTAVNGTRRAMIVRSIGRDRAGRERSHAAPPHRLAHDHSHHTSSLSSITSSCGQPANRQVIR
jgi:hypothetical protein